jgi:hypothetical protein
VGVSSISLYSFTKQNRRLAISYGFSIPYTDRNHFIDGIPNHLANRVKEFEHGEYSHTAPSCGNDAIDRFVRDDRGVVVLFAAADRGSFALGRRGIPG